MASPAAGSERGGRTGDGVGVGVELLQLRGGAVQRRLQLLEFGGSRRYSEETLTMTRQDTTWRRFFFLFSHIAPTGVSVLRLKKRSDGVCGEREEAEERKQMWSTEKVEVETGREAAAAFP